jgi:hypothetical protein
MLQFAHLLDRTMQIAGPFLIGLAVVLWMIAFGAAAIAVWRQGWGARRRPPALFVWPGLGFMVIVGGWIGATAFFSHAAIDEVHQRLNGPVAEIRVDGKPAADPERLLSALRQIKPHNYHHSHPTTVYRIALQTTEGPWELWLGRDSTVPDEYWVFYPGFDQANDIGTVVSDALD